MDLDRLIRNPAFQLNLLLWMAKEQPGDCARVFPLFAKLGFVLLNVESPFPLPEELARQVQAIDLEISVQPEPELVLQRPGDRKALYFEAKRSSFGTESSTSKQARGHLLACGPAFAEVLAPLQESLLCYVLPEDQTERMASCLAELRSQLANAGLVPGTTSVHGFRVENGTRLLYVWDQPFADFVEHGNRTGSALLLEAADSETDPCPLILIHSDEDYPDPEAADRFRVAFLRRFQACLLCSLQRSRMLGKPMVVGLGELLNETTDGTYEYLGPERQKSLRRLVNERVVRPIREYLAERGTDLLERKADQVTFHFPAKELREKFLDWLERTEFRGAFVPPPEDPLFDAMGIRHDE
jgi:hypothetical protein